MFNNYSDPVTKIQEKSMLYLFLITGKQHPNLNNRHSFIKFKNHH